MKILAFETSCDDTAVAIVENGCRVLSSVRVSQVEHEAWGGVVPEIAARLHAESWRPVLKQALKEAKLTIQEIDYLACTQGPGLQTSLLSGTLAGSLLSTLYQIPLLPVHHIYGHLCSVFLEREDLAVIARQKNEWRITRQSSPPPTPPSGRGVKENNFYPALVLTASGGHTEFYLWQGAIIWQKLGGSLDDAVGEAFDKVAKMLGLGYPGGPLVSRRAALGDPKKYNFPVPKVPELDLSFAGVKAAVRRLVEDEYPELLEKKSIGVLSPPPAPPSERGAEKEKFINDVCASFEDVCGRIFVKKLTLALQQHPAVKTFCFVGGVSANKHLNKVFKVFMQQYGIKVLTPAKLEYSTDNAAMIAGAAYWQLQKDLSQATVQYVEAVPRLSL